MGNGSGIGLTKEEADKVAKKEYAERSYYPPAPNHIIKCSKQNAGELKVIYIAHNEINKLIPGIITE